jgi:hypothetical protein
VNQLEVFMTRLRQIAIASLGSLALSITMVGCMGSHPDAISANAVMETSGDKTLTWTASSPGRLTVYDKSSDKIVYGATVAAGQAVKVDVDNNRVMLDSQVVSENSLHGGDEYKIYFEPTATVQSSEQTIESRSVQTVHTP